MHQAQQQIELTAPKGAKPRTGRLSRLVLAGPRWLRSRTREAGGVDEIQEGGRLIRDLVTTLRRGPAAPPRIYTNADRHLDLMPTAFSHGLSVAALEERMSLRRRQTTRVAYSAFGGGWLILGLWLWQALATPWSAGRAVLGLEFIPFCAVFFLLAFKAAWQNWQLRRGRLGSAMEYLTTTEPFWPS
jgi:hypothetical protein